MDDDLDALLDNALETMNEQEEALEREKKAHEAAAQTLLNEALGGNAGPGMDGDMLKTLTNLMSILQKGPEAMENASEEEMVAIQAQLQNTLDQMKKHPGLTAEDQTQLGSMSKMMDHLNAMEKGSEPSHGSDDPPLSEEEFNKRREELTKMLEAMGSPGGIMGGAGGGGPNLPPFPFANLASAASSSEGKANGPPPPVSEEDACRQVFELTLGLLQEKDIEQPFAKLRAAYGPWLETHADTLSPEEKTRYENQYRVAGEMCEFFKVSKVSEVLKEGSGASTEERAAILEKFGTLMAELHSFGEAPSDLFGEEQPQQ